MSSRQNTRRRPSLCARRRRVKRRMQARATAKWNSKGSDEVEEVRTRQKVDEHVWNDLVMVQQKMARGRMNLVQTCAKDKERGKTLNQRGISDGGMASLRLELSSKGSSFIV
ncbi:hypothetical protein NL676_025704 [Syzygium grande]|nr:hypothetical protein NL676_025704 [Syzygium grande]